MREIFDYNDLTILIQGPYDYKIAEKVIHAVLVLFPLSQVVFSTWDGSKINIQNLDNHKIKFLLNKDPGPDYESMFKSNEKTNVRLNSNAIRMIFSSLSGLKLIKTNWTLRIRSDILMKSLKFIDDYFTDYYSSINFNSKILVSKVVDSKHIDKFFIDDWFEFGTTKDLKHLFSNAYNNILNYKVERLNENFIINNHVFSEKILWNSLYEDINSLSDRDFYEEFVDNNLLIINNFNQRCFRNLKYPSHNSMIYSFFHDISYKRHYELVHKRNSHRFKNILIIYLRKLNFFSKKIKSKQIS